MVFVNRLPLQSVVLAGTLCLGATACDRRPAGVASAGPRAAQTNVQTFQVKGVVKQLTPADEQVRIQHEKIPGYMEAMTMNFDVKDTNELAGLTVGDEVAFRLCVTDTDGWIDQIKRLGRATVTAAGDDVFRKVKDVDPLQIGDAVPDYAFTNELGRRVRLSEFQGRAVAITFIFTRCPFPVYCPRMSENFVAAQNQLKALPGGPTNWHLITISFDPQFDTPAVLKSYGRRYNADPDRWSFFTGELIEITALAEQFGQFFWKPENDDPGGLSHNQRTVVLDSRGRVRRIFKENTWKVDELVAELVAAAKPQP